MSSTPPARVKSRLAAAFGWTPAEPLSGRSLGIAVLGMSVPALAGLALHKPEIGFTIGLGAMLLADTPSAPQSVGGADCKPSPDSILLPAALAVALATVLGGEPWSDVAMIALAGVAAALSGYSRPVAVGAIRFIIYFVLSYTLLQNAGGHRGAAALIFGLGAVWNILIRLLLTHSRAARAKEASPVRLRRAPLPRPKDARISAGRYAPSRAGSFPSASPSASRSPMACA